MKSFPGKIGFVNGEDDDVAAVITLDGIQLQIQTGDTSIGEWPIKDMNLEFGRRGYHVILDGEEVVLDPLDRYGFSTAFEVAQEAANEKKTRRARRLEKRNRDDTVESTEPTQDVPSAVIAGNESSTIEETGSERPTRSDQRAAARIAKEEDKAARAEAKQVAKAARAGAKQVAKAEKRRAAQADDTDPRPVPRIPGLEDPDKDALWETHHNDEDTSFRSKLNSRSGTRVLWTVGVALVVVLAYLAPTVASLMLVIPGAAAVILAALGLLDPVFTRLLPPSLNEIRLMIIGVGFFVASLLVSAIF